MNKTMTVIIVVVLVLLGGVYYFKMNSSSDKMIKSESDQTMEALTVTVNLAEQNDSGESGVATLSENDGKVTVSVKLDNPAGDLQPSHIHAGECPGIGAVVYPLTNVQDGISETVLDVSLDDLKSQMPLAINVHKSAAQANIYTSCGDLQIN